jgi:DNA ligase 1
VKTATSRGLKFRKPMSAKLYEEHEQDVAYPCYAQPKVDGIRCITNGRLFWSKNGKLFPQQNLVHLQMPLFPHLVDGELSLIDGYSDFEEIASVVKRAGHKDAERLCFNAFDIITDQPYAARKIALKKLFETMQMSISNNHWHRLMTKKVDSPFRLDELHRKFLDMGYEGTMIRNAFGLYVSKRTVNLLKRKPLDDGEFEIIDVVEAKGKDKGTPIFVCWAGDNRNGASFRARPMGTMKQRRKMWRERRQVVGGMLTVEHQGFTRYGKPRFPRAKVLRNYE